MNGNMLYVEGASGISGDMTVAALLDLGGSREKLDAVLKSMNLAGFDYEISRGNSYGIAGCCFNVNLHEEHHHTVHGHTHEHRNLAAVYAVIDRGEMSVRARELAKKIFRAVAEAEAQAHGIPLEQVHFHEVGAVDSIADIVAAAVLADDLNITECVVSGLTEGQGTVHCQHGDLPVPVPAVLNIAQKYGIALRPSPVNGEMVTPTGIAIAAALRTRRSLPSSWRIVKTGIGIGKRDFGHANILRVMLIEEETDPEQIYVLETNIDDAAGETLGLAMDRLMAAGAFDVHFIPCFMKKNRPAYILRVIAAASEVPMLERIIFESTTTIGMRKLPVDRTCMERESLEVALPYGTVSVKRCTWNGLVRNYPEYESVKALAESTGKDFQLVFAAAKLAAEELK